MNLAGPRPRCTPEPLVATLAFTIVNVTLERFHTSNDMVALAVAKSDRLVLQARVSSNSTLPVIVNLAASGGLIFT
jgi:hypothetical protein